MSQIYRITNEYQGILDLSVIKDTAGAPVVLRPRGMAGASRECYQDAVNHPRVKAMKDAKWLSVADVMTKPVAPTPLPTPKVEAKPDAPPPPPAATVPEKAPEKAPEPPKAEVPPAPIETAPAPAEAAAEAPAEPLAATPDVSDVPAAEEAPAPAPEHRRKRR